MSNQIHEIIHKIIDFSFWFLLKLSYINYCDVIIAKKSK